MLTEKLLLFSSAHLTSQFYFLQFHAVFCCRVILENVDDSGKAVSDLKKNSFHSLIRKVRSFSGVEQMTSNFSLACKRFA